MSADNSIYSGWKNAQWADYIQQVENSFEEVSDASGVGVLGEQETALLIDHTLLKLDATPEQIDNLCDQAKEYGFKVSIKVISISCMPLPEIMAKTSIPFNRAVCHVQTLPRDVFGCAAGFEYY